MNIADAVQKYECRIVYCGASLTSRTEVANDVAAHNLYVLINSGNRNDILEDYRLLPSGESRIQREHV